MEYCQHHFQSGVMMSDIREGQRSGSDYSPPDGTTTTHLSFGLSTHTHTGLLQTS